MAARIVTSVWPGEETDAMTKESEELLRLQERPITESWSYFSRHSNYLSTFVLAANFGQLKDSRPRRVCKQDRITTRGPSLPNPPPHFAPLQTSSLLHNGRTRCLLLLVLVHYLFLTVFMLDTLPDANLSLLYPGLELVPQRTAIKYSTLYWIEPN